MTLDCGALTPLLFFGQSEKNKSGVKAPHSKKRWHRNEAPVE
jgi:hypothetical protein